MSLGSGFRRLGRTLVARALQGGALLTRPMTLGVRVAVFDEAGRVLLVRHGYMPGWHLPGGGVEPGESFYDAMRRETREEACVAIEGMPPLHGVFRNRRRDHVAVFVVRSFRRLGERAPDWEIRATGFFPPTALPEGTTGGTRRRLAEILDGAPIAETW